MKRLFDLQQQMYEDSSRLKDILFINFDRDKPKATELKKTKH
jgi:hypothetical protein